MREPCPICRGAQVIRLPVYQSVQADAPLVSCADTASKTFPCPECAPGAPNDRVAFVEFHTEVDAPEGVPPEYLEHASRNAGLALGAKLFADGFIATRDHPLPARQFGNRRKIVATIGVVAPKNVATMKQRIAEHQDKVARDVAEEAVQQINNWGSYYHHQSVQKEDARRLIRDALRIVLERHKQETAT